jgi:hypothetical protein
VKCAKKKEISVEKVKKKVYLAFILFSVLFIILLYYNFFLFVVCQKNFYLDQDEEGEGHLQPIICDLCDQGQVASHKCTRCHLMLCFHCHRSHGNCQITARSQVKVTAADSSSKRGSDMQLLLAEGKSKILFFYLRC